MVPTDQEPATPVVGKAIDEMKDVSEGTDKTGNL